MNHLDARGRRLDGPSPDRGAAGPAGTPGILIHSERLVEADTATIWRVLRNQRWAWSGFMSGLRVPAAGEHGVLRLRGLPGGIPIAVRIVAFEPEREIRWIGGIPGVFTGEHYLRLHPEGARTRVEHGELFEGAVGVRAVSQTKDALTKLYASEIERLAAAAVALTRAESLPGEPPPLPDSEQAITPAWLESAVAQRHEGVRVRSVKLAEASRAGDGLASTADRLALVIEYDEDADVGLPTRMLLKTILLGGGLRVGPGAIRLLARATNGLGLLPFGIPSRDLLFRGLTRFQERFPQAPDAMYENEVRFYRDIRPELTVETPRTFASLRDPKSRRFGVLMEDLGARKARFPTACDELTAADMRALLSTLAALHAHFWKSPRLENDLAWVPTSTSGGMFEVFDGLGRELIRAQLALYPFKRDLIAVLGRELDEMWAATWATQRAMKGEPQTLLHGDPHIGNTYLLPDGTAGLLDWQLMMRGCFAHDVTYVMASGLPTDVRRREERALLAHYLDALAARGVPSPPSLDATFELYRRNISWGLVIGWLITPPQNYGIEITSANVRRLATAAADLGTFEVGA